MQYSNFHSTGYKDVDWINLAQGIKKFHKSGKFLHWLCDYTLPQAVTQPVIFIKQCGSYKPCPSSIMPYFAALNICRIPNFCFVGCDAVQIWVNTSDQLGDSIHMFMVAIDCSERLVPIYQTTWCHTTEATTTKTPLNCTGHLSSPPLNCPDLREVNKKYFSLLYSDLFCKQTLRECLYFRVIILYDNSYQSFTQTVSQVHCYSKSPQVMVHTFHFNVLQFVLRFSSPY
jgi:hypothetical protein